MIILTCRQNRFRSLLSLDTQYTSDNMVAFSSFALVHWYHLVIGFAFDLVLHSKWFMKRNLWKH